jgi:biotin carboxylase
MRDVLFLCATERDRREVARLADSGDIRFHFHEYATSALESLVAEEPPERVAIDDPQAEIDRILARFRANAPDAVVSTDDYPGTALASIVARTLGLRGVDPAVNLLCQHKHRSRCAQSDAVPHATPAFELVDGHDAAPSIGFPMFLKPVKSCFSVGASRVASPSELPAAIRRSRLPPAYFEPFRSLLARYSDLDLGSPVLAESLLDGWQCTLDGYAHGGDVEVLGIVDSVMLDGTLSFERFDYPSRLPDDVQARMHDVARQLIAHIGYRDGMFNIELMYGAREDRVSIIEVNPRMSSQFADLYEKVDGTNSYRVLLDLALGDTPRFTRRRGAFRCAASCVLRRLDNGRPTRVPSRAEIEEAARHHPDARIEILARTDRNLSQELQDGTSYRYGVINLGGSDEPEIRARFADCVARLPFSFEPVRSAARVECAAWRGPNSTSSS